MLAEPKGDQARTSLPLLLLLLIVGGSADGLSKFYSTYGNPALEGYYLCFIFACAGLLCGVLCLYQRQKPNWRDAAFGLLLGIPNYFSSFFLLRSLSDIPASVAYPVFSCGTILLTAVGGRLCFGEHIRGRQWIALGLVLVALALLNM